MSRRTAGRSVVIHGHYYQPPREAPWLEVLEREPGAAPFHDWNQRIERECYRAVVAARVPGPDGRIAKIVNTLEWTSFDAGPTLLSWMERAAPETYARFLEADRRSLARLGHGNAIAMPYHHVILPLASRRDKQTEVRWGMADFRRRFGRDPEGMWLPETAVDDETLDVLAEAGIWFTILAPGQVEAAPPDGRPGRYTTSAGRSIALLVYDGDLSHQVAFGPLIRDATAWLSALESRTAGRAGPSTVTIATDGETYGHHHPFGEMALAAVIEGARRSGFILTNPAALLATTPELPDLALVAPSSWSCAHGVERWRADCGCRLDPQRFPSQAWRAPLRESLAWLAGQLHERFGREGAFLFGDPWAARDALAGEDASPMLLPAARELLEMERNALRMFTSCGWFFDDLAGIETLQVLRYAARAVELAGDERQRLWEEFGRRLGAARANDPTLGTGRDLLATRAVPRAPAAARAAAAHAATQLFPWGIQDRAHLAWEASEGEDGRLEVTDRRTGATHVADGTVARDETGRLTFRVQLDGHEPGHLLGLGDLPEPAQAVVRAALVTALFPDDLATGLYDLGVPLRAAMGTRLLELLPGELDLPSLDPALLHGALDLLELDGEPVPFDAQTRFWELMTNGSAALREALQPFAPRFGFARDAFDGILG